MSNLILFWHRKDLRISDNIGLYSAYENSPKVLGVFCLDPEILKGDDMAAVRVAYMLGCLQKLQESYRKLGGDLLVIQGDPKTAIANFAQVLNAKSVYFNLDVEPYSKIRDEAVINALKEKGIKSQTFWDQLLHSPLEIKTGAKQPYSVYTPYWKNWIKQPKKSPVEIILPFEGLMDKEQAIAAENGVIPLPKPQDLGFNWHGDFILEPGEKSALEQLEYFSDRAINNYQEMRNFPAIEGTSLLSPSLKFGVIGIRKVWAKTQECLNKAVNNKQQESIETWQKELAWREFYQQALYWFPELETGAYREPFKTFPWVNNEKHFLAWCEGQTGYPIIDAAMRQLNHTGWMHNRCRMIVASFLTKDLIVDWQWGEKYFMQRLIDGDLAANNGGWQWSASSGMDPKPLRIFNPYTQAEKFDPKADYIREWIPELKGVNTKDILSGKIAPLERSRCNYPAPIVDHNLQQRKFKELYQQQKISAE
jgi:deoxyribodipyrimidine photo-lyase